MTSILSSFFFTAVILTAVSSHSVRELSDNDSIQLESVHSFKVNSVSHPLRTKNITTRSTHKSSLQVEFEAYGESFQYVVHHSPQHAIFDTDSEIHVYEGDKLAYITRSPTYDVYESESSNGDKARVVTFPSGEMMVIVLRGGEESFTVEPLSLHENDLQDHEHKRLSSVSSMVVYKHSQLSGLNHAKDCGVAHPENENINITDSRDDGDHKRQSSTYPTRWTNCFPNPNVARSVRVGTAADVSLFKRLGGTSQVTDAFASIFAKMNTVYYNQVGVSLVIGEAIIQTTSGGPNWNEDRTSGGCSDISTKLNRFTSWAKSNKASRPEGLWQLLTDCHPPPGTVGIAWVGTLCNPNNFASVSSYSSSFWLTIAHELGHNFGAGHTFQEGQGRTGGIMDYGNGLLNGIYQFHTQYTKESMCRTISNALSRYPSCLSGLTTSCGNGVLESGEECDDSSPCCQQCKLAAGAQCSGGACCSSSCKLLPSWNTCPLAASAPRNVGYCGLPTCTTPKSNGYRNTQFCPILESNPCVERLRINGGNCISGDRVNPRMYAPDGTLCSATNPSAKCYSGKCVCSKVTCGSNECGTKADGCGGTIFCPCNQDDITDLTPEATFDEPEPTSEVDSDSNVEESGGFEWNSTQSLAIGGAVIAGLVVVAAVGTVIYRRRKNNSSFSARFW